MLIASSLVELYFSYRETQQAIVRVERAKAVAAATGIEQFLKEIEQQVRETTRLVSDDPDASQVGPVRLGFREGLGAALAEQRELDFLRILRNVPAVSQLTHLDLAGKEQLRVSRLDPDVVGSQEDFSRAPQFLEARTGKTYWSPVYLKNGSEPYVTLALPVGKYAVEVTTAEVNLGAVLKIVVADRGRLGRLRLRGGLPQPAGRPSGRPGAAREARSLRARAGESRAGRARGRRPRARRRRWSPTAWAASASWPRTRRSRRMGWLVFVERPAAAAYAPLRAPIIRSVVIFVLGLGLSILASILLARRMVAPIRVLQEGAARIGAGDLAHRIEIRTGDELQTLGDELNRTASRLEESYAGLERKVAERTRDLTEALQRLTALSEVGRAVSSTLDLQTVLNSIVVHAGPLAGADGCAIYEYEEATQEFHLRATHNYDPALVAAITASPLRKGEGVMGRAAERGEPIQVPDITQPGAYETRQRDVLVRAGFRALLSVPLLFEDRIIGSLSVNRKAPGEYSSDVIEVLKTFATQSVLSLENARLFREIADQSRELEIASQHKSEFLANMSHELRTPLNAIIGFSEVLLERMFGEMNDKQTEYLHDIMGSGRHLLSLINDILDLSKVEAGRMELEPSEFHLPTALDDACTLVRERASRRNIALRVTVDERIGEVRADERKIKQVMLNLLSNAVKFTPEGGRIEVRAVPSNGFVRSVGQRYRRRHRAGGPGRRVRRVPAGGHERGQARGHRAGPGPVSEVHRAARRQDLGREPGWRGVHLHVHHPDRRLIRS